MLRATDVARNIPSCAHLEVQLHTAVRESASSGGLTQKRFCFASVLAASFQAAKEESQIHKELVVVCLRTIDRLIDFLRIDRRLIRVIDFLNCLLINFHASPHETFIFSNIGTTWDLLQILFEIAACAPEALWPLAWS